MADVRLRKLMAVVMLHRPQHSHDLILSLPALVCCLPPLCRDHCQRHDSPCIPDSPCLTPTETMALLSNTSSSTAAPLPPSSPATSTPEMPMDAFTTSAAAPQGSSPAASSITTAQERGSTAHSITGLPELGLTTGTPKEVGLTTGTPAPTSMAITPNCPKTTNVPSVGTSTALALSSFGVEMSTLPPPTSALLSSTWVGTTLGTSTHQGPATTMLQGSTSPGSGSTSSATTPALTDTSKKPLTTPSDTTASLITSTVAAKRTPAPSQPVVNTARTTLGTSTLAAPKTPSATAETTAMGVTATTSPSPPTSSISMETSAQLPTTDSTTAATLSPSSPETEASTPERSSTSPGTGSSPTPTTPPPTTTATSSEPLTTLANTTASPVTSMEVPLSTPSPSHPARTTSRTTPDIFPPTMESTPGIEFSFPTTNSTQTSEVTRSTPADPPVPPPVCPTGSSNTSTSRLFLSLRLSTPLDLGNSTVQELVLSKLREDLQTAFPCAGLSLEWRGKRRLGAAAVPVITEGPFSVGTAYPITAENEGHSALVTGTADTSTTAADAEIDESIFTRSPLSSTFPPGAEPDSFVTVMSEYGPTVPALMNVTKPLNTSQGIEGGLAAPTTATTAAAITAQHPAVTPEAEYEVIEATPDPILDITPDVKEDIPEAVTRGEEDIDLTNGNVPLPTTPPPADTWVPQPTAGSPVGVGVTVLPSQGLTTAMGAVEEVITLPASIQTGANGKSSSPNPSAEELLTTQQGGVVSRIEGTNPEPAEEMAPAAEESPLVSESGDAGDATNDELASGMPAPLGEASPHAPIPPNAAPVLPSAPQRGSAAEGVSVSPGLSAPLAALPAVPLYGYGARENDREYVERRVDFNSPLFKPETGFPFGRTLRDSLYFTDNGQIIFPASDKGIFTYPNPPPGGFNGHEEVPMIAVFWDNADFSRGVGTTFYQEFSTLNTAKPPFVRDVEAKVRRYMRSSYSAAWTLKITWEKAPVYSSRTDTRKTITYQAVLTTDGFRSYILMLYQDGGMQWDYTRLTATNVLIGYTSGDGFYHNDDLSKRPPAAKYRPDQFRGYNTDLRGLWIYKLESRVGINYRLKCLAWTGQQQEPRTWSQGLPTCPCSLQQGQQDPRFKSSRGGRWAARVSMLHSASPNQHGAGVRCLYDSQNQLIEGRQERYWRSSRQASPYRDQELKLYDWCCNRASSAHLCARYSEKRPKIGCDGYQSPGMDSSEEVERDSDEEIDEDDK
ncbi:mucin-4-like [Myiozetetes cayanensis]|uniref:mucin-4-like n=1 Tax=Myiozetetes cayanensis TaxID=478635 RepID=UPI002160C371|nr:mucin-4-like [Myiozetetes cayanensis]